MCYLALNLPGLIGLRIANSGVKSVLNSGNIGGWGWVRSRDRATNWHLDAKKKKEEGSLGDKVKVVVIDNPATYLVRVRV